MKAPLVVASTVLVTALVAVLYGLLVYYSLDETQRRVVRMAWKHADKIGTGGAPAWKVATFVLRVARVPFADPAFFDKITESSIYTSQVYETRSAEDVGLLNDKLFWADVFREEGIPHPAIVAYNSGGVGVPLRQYDLAGTYLYKPVRETMGRGIQKIQGTDVAAAVESGEGFVQELMRDCGRETRAFRFVTFFNGDAHSLWQKAQPDRSKVVVNSLTGGRVTLCAGLQCADATELEHAELDALMGQLCELHARRFADVLSIGWDIMLACKDGDRQRGYCLEGNILHSSWYYPQFAPDDVVASYRRHAEVFYDRHFPAV